jgi:hypothetical protein
LNKNWFKPVWLGFLDKNRCKPVWLDFIFLARFFGQKLVQPGLAQFFLVFFGLGSVWFFRFWAYKTETKPNRLVF